MKTCALVGLSALVAIQLFAQPYGEPDRGQPGDAMIQNYLVQETAKVEADFLGGVKSSADWDQVRPRFLQEYYDMLGLWPWPAKTPLHATRMRTLNKEDYAVDMIHYQSRPGLYVTGNLYRPAKIEPGQRLPAILYVCGHSARARNGNKTAYQAHGIWLARHGYVCLILDTLQLGEIAGIHHGTYREGRWWWISRGYTPAGVEAWNGIRGLDYLVGRPDVDPERIGVTGISGGGAATFWVAAADDRVKVAVPVSGMADLISYVPNRVINGHCDCMFLYNTYQWPWARIAALIAPRPLLFVNSDQDPIFPMDANERGINRLERLYSLFGAGDLVDSLVSVGGHAYRKDIRQGAFRFLNTHLKNDPRPVLDSESDVVGGSPEGNGPIPPEELRVFPRDADIPADAVNDKIDEQFVSMAQVAVPDPAGFGAWQRELLAQLRRLTFRHFPERIPPAQLASEPSGPDAIRLVTEPGITIRLRTARTPPAAPERVVLWVSWAQADEPRPDLLRTGVTEKDAVYICEPRGLGGTRWTRKNPPNYVERSHYLLGRTVDSGRVWDIVAAARYVRARHQGQSPVHVAGQGPGAALAVYAALLEPDIAGLLLDQLPRSHMEQTAPALLNVLRVCDLPDALGLAAPRPVTVTGARGPWLEKTAALYRANGAADKLTLR